MLLEEIAAGDRQALAELFERYSDAVRAFLAARGVGGAELDDLVQTTFLAVARAAANFREESKASTWVIGVASNILRHHRRGEGRRQRGLGRLAVEPNPAAPPQPDRVAQHRRYLSRLEAAVERLPPRLRTAYQTCVVDQVPGRLAAQRLGVPAGTLTRQVREIRVRLAAEIGWRSWHRCETPPQD
jgi:RNA polymerase sigma-70 factor (ECF subfamily)